MNELLKQIVSQMKLLVAAELGIVALLSAGVSGTTERPPAIFGLPVSPALGITALFVCMAFFLACIGSTCVAIRMHPKRHAVADNSESWLFLYPTGEGVILGSLWVFSAPVVVAIVWYFAHFQFFTPRAVNPSCPNAASLLRWALVWVVDPLCPLIVALWSIRTLHCAVRAEAEPNNSALQVLADSVGHLVLFGGVWSALHVCVFYSFLPESKRTSETWWSFVHYIVDPTFLWMITSLALWSCRQAILTREEVMRYRLPESDAKVTWLRRLLLIDLPKTL